MNSKILRRTAIRAIAVTVLGLTALTASGCSAATTASATASGGNVVIGYGDVDSLDPIQFKSNTGYTVLNNVYGTLTAENYTKSKNGTLVGNNTYSPSLAKSITYNSAGTLLTIVLKPNLKFQNGSPLSADDVVYTIQRSLSDAGYTSVFQTYLNIADAEKDIKAVNSTTVQIVTTQKAALLEKFLSFETFGILDKAAAEKYGTGPWATDYFAKNVVSSGPYEVSKWTPGSSIVLKKNPNYTVANLSDAPTTVTIQNIPNADQEYLALSSGSIDMAMGLPPKLAKKAQSNPKTTVRTSPAGDLVYMGMNVKDPALSNVKVRQAISYLIPYTSLRENVMQGFANSAYGPVPYPMVTSLDTTGKKDAYPTSTAKAEALLKSAGVSNLSLTLSVDATDASSVQSATFIQSALKAAGIKLTVDQMTDADYNTALGERKLQMFLGEWYSWGEDPIYQMNFLLSTPAFTDYTGYSNPKFDALALQGINETSSAQRESTSQQLQELAIADAPMAFLYTRDYVAVSNQDLSGITQPDDAFPMFQYLRLS